MVKNGVVAMLFWANGVIFLLFLLGITSEWRNVLGIFCCRNLLCGFLVIEVLAVSVICARKFTCFVVSVICLLHKTKKLHLGIFCVQGSLHLLC